MFRPAALILAAAPVALGAAIVAPAAAQSQAPLAQVSAHLKAVDTMTASFTQTDRRGRSVSGTMQMKRPGKIRFEYQKGVLLLIVADGKRLTMLDYQVGQKSSWPIGNSPLAVLLDPSKNLGSVAKVVSDTPQVLLVRARDPKRPEYGTITIGFAKVSGAPGGLMLQGWNMVDAQSNHTNVRLANQRFNVGVADSAFTYAEPKKRRS